MPPSELINQIDEILSTHHALLHRELPRLAQTLQSAPPQIRAPFFHLHHILSEHLMKEEQILFPLIRAIASGEGAGGCGIEGPIRQMEAEHEQIRMLETSLRAAARDAGPEEHAILALLDDLCEHAQKEDELVFPAALKMVGIEAAPKAAPEPRTPPPAPQPFRPQVPPPQRPGVINRIRRFLHG